MLQVNHSPSFRCDTELDQNVKGGVIQGALVLCQNLHPVEALDCNGLISGSSSKEPYQACYKTTKPLIMEGYHWLGEWALPEVDAL